MCICVLSVIELMKKTSQSPVCSVIGFLFTFLFFFSIPSFSYEWRQKFYENLSSKARPKRRSPQSADDHNLSQSIEAKLQAAEQKRYSSLIQV